MNSKKETETLPSYNDVQKLFSETILASNKEYKHTYLEFDKLIEEWHCIKNKNKSESASDRLRKILNFVSMYSIDTKNPFFISKLYSGSDSLSLLADMLISYYNTNVHVYSVSPVFTMAEYLMVDRISQLINPNGYGDGIFLPGGSYCNLVGLISARHFWDSKIKADGMSSMQSPLKIITSNRSHYSIKKAAIMMGVGLNNVIQVDLENISMNEFEEILDSNNVFCICTTFGTTSEGVLESIEKFRPLLSSRRVWHHVDACVGGILVYSDRNKKVTSNLKRADSIGMDFHKIANIAVQCSALMIRKSKSYVLKEVASVNADYLFHSNDNNHDISVMSFQCGRKADAFRLFILDNVIDLGVRVDSFLDRVDTFKQIINSDDRYEQYEVETNMTHVLFTPMMMIDNMNPEEIHQKIGQIIRALRTENIFLEYHDTYVRLVPINPHLTDKEFIHILDRIDHYA